MMKRDKLIFNLVVLISFILMCQLSFAQGGTNLPVLWEGNIQQEVKSLEGLEIQSNAILPTLLIKIKGENSEKVEVSPNKGKPFYPLYFRDGIARFPFKVENLDALKNVHFNSKKSNIELSIEPETPLVITSSKFGFDIANWGLETEIYLSVTDAKKNIVPVITIDKNEFLSFPKNYLGRLERGEQISFLLASEWVKEYPVKVEVYNSTGQKTETTIYKPEEGSYLCATPGKDGDGGTLSGIVNTYYPLTSSATSGSTTINVGTPSGASTQISPNDLLLIIQMQDGEADYSNSDAYGDGISGGDAKGYTAINQAGKYEFVKALSFVSGGSLSILGAGVEGGLINSYNVTSSTTTKGRSSAQVVRVPQYTSATLSSTLTCLGWNGVVGGILAIDISGTLTLGGTVSVDGMGFRGGIGRQLTGGTADKEDYRIDSSINCFGLKGEGICGTPAIMPNSNAGTGLQGYPNGDSGWGAPGNAGGGGNDSTPNDNQMNAGGGGGANAGNGGRGGNTWNANEPLGGYGGASVSISADRLILGGGGGAGDRNNAGDSSGAAGGGIVIIRANAIEGNGTITANGADGVTCANDGSGGGGAGGTILIYSRTTSDLSGLTVSANGGKGGDNWLTAGNLIDRHGPGGGGGGGAIIISGSPYLATVSGGANGVTTSLNDSFGATPGSSGIVITTLNGNQIPGVDAGAECSGSTTYIVKTSSEGNNYVSPGQTINYTVTVTNTTGSTWTNVGITDPLPTGTSWVSTQLTYPVDFSGDYYDQFSTISYSGSNGTIDWSSPWVEIGDDGNVSGGDVRVVTDGATNALRLNRASNGASRSADLSGYSNATLSFNYRREGTDNANDNVTVSVYDGTSWVTLTTIYGGTNETEYLNSGDISIPSSCLNSSFTLRFLTSTGNGKGDRFYFDNIMITVSGREYATSSGGSPPNIASGYTLYPYETLTAVITVTVDSNLSPTITEISNTASFSADGGLSQDATAVNPVLPAPSVNAPIYVNNTTISGTSTVIGGTVTIYQNGSPIGTAIVQGDGTWVLTGVSGLSEGDSITASVTFNGATSPNSSPVTVSNQPPNAPSINGPLTEGETVVSGTSDAPDGSTVTVYVDGIPYTGIVDGGTFSVTVPSLEGGDQVYATVTVNGQTSDPSTTETVHYVPPTVNSPIYSGATTVSGSSSSADGTVITVYVNGNPVGTTVVSQGSWTLTGIGPLATDDVVTATAGTGASESQQSDPVVVIAPPLQSVPPIVTSPIIEGGNVTITGSSVEPVGSIVIVYVDGNPVGTTTVNEDGSWSLPGVTVSDGQTVSATVQAPGEEVSNPSNSVTVSANSSDLTPPPVISGPIYGEATSISGTSVPYATIDVYQNGIYLGTTTADEFGNWTLTGLSPLQEGTIVSATATVSPTGTSNWADPKVVGGIIHILRNDSVTNLNLFNRDEVFKRKYPNGPVLEPLGANHTYNEGEGTLQEGNGSNDDDDFYLRDVHQPVVDPDPTVLTDASRPLVFYELIDNGENNRTIFLSKDGGVITITFTP